MSYDFPPSLPLGPSSATPYQAAMAASQPAPVRPAAASKPPPAAKKLSKKAEKQKLDENAAARSSGDGEDSKDGDKDLKKGAWTDEEDAALRHYIQV